MRQLTRLILLFATAVPVSASSGSVEDDAGVLGVWASKGSVFSITRDGEELRGEVIAMRKPRLDRENPDPLLRERSVIGLQVLNDYRFNNGIWRGKLYDPGSGYTYSSYLKLDADGNLRLRGYVGFSLLGKTEVFEPVGRCSERIISMLRTAEIEHLC